MTKLNSQTKMIKSISQKITISNLECLSSYHWLSNDPMQTYEWSFFFNVLDISVLD